MTEFDAAMELGGISIRHRGDGDGGYAEVAEIVRLAEALNSSERNLLRLELVRRVDMQDQGTWGIAIECLVRAWGVDVSSELASLLDRRPRTREWEEQVLLALLGLRFLPVAERAIIHLSKRIDAGDRTVISLLAALCRVDIESCLSLLAPYLIEVLEFDGPSNLEGSIQAAFSHFADIDPNLVVLLVQKVAAKNRQAAFTIAQLFCEHMDRPFVLASLGSALTERLKHQLCGQPHRD